MRPKYSLAPLLLGLSIFAWPSHAQAAISMDYYTYGGFDIINSAFNFIALIFSDNNYIGLSAVVFGTGMIIAKAMALAGGMRSLSGMVMAAMFGTMVFNAIIIPKGTILLYDPVKNKTAVIGNVPVGLVLLAGGLNSFERSMVRIIKTAGTPVPYGNQVGSVPYDQQAGGIGIDMIYNLHSGGVMMIDEYMRDTLVDYTKNCVFFEMERRGTRIRKPDIAKNTDLITVYGNAINLAIYTTWRDANYPAGLIVTCDAAWKGGVDEYYGVNVPGLNAFLSNPASFDNDINTRCAEAGYDPTNPVELTQCKNMSSSLVSWLEGTAFTTTSLFQNTLLAHTFNDTLVYASPGTAAAAMATRQSGNAMYATGMVANTSLPVAMNVLTGVAIGMVPFFALFIVSPILGRALGMIAGLFLWITTWHIADAMMHGFAMTLAYSAFEEVRRFQLGYSAVAGFGTASLKALGMMGYMRFGGMAIATVASQQLFQFGSVVLAQLGGQATAASQQGAGVAADGMTPEGKAKAIENYREGIASMGNAKAWSFDDDVGSRLASRRAQTKAGVEMNEFYGGPEAAGDAMGHSRAMSGIGSAEQHRGLDGNVMAMEGGSNQARMMQKLHAFSDKMDSKEIYANTGLTSYVSTLQHLSNAKATDEMLQTGIQDGMWKDRSQGMLAMAAMGKFGEYGGAQSRQAVADELADRRYNLKDGASWKHMREAAAHGDMRELAKMENDPRYILATQEMKDMGGGNLAAGIKKENDLRMAEASRKMGSYGASKQGADYLLAGEAARIMYADNNYEQQMLKLSGFMQTHTLDKESAEGLNNHFGTKAFKEGMRVDFGQANGKLYNVHATKGDDIVAAGTFDPNRREDRAKLEEAYKQIKTADPNTAAMLRKEIDSGHAVKMNASYSKNGRLATAAFEHGGRMQVFDTANHDIGKSGSIKFDTDTIGKTGFEAAGLHFLSGSIRKEGDEYALEGTTHTGYHVSMRGRGGEILKDKNGHFTGLSHFEPTVKSVEKVDRFTQSKEYNDINKFTIDRNDSVTFSNLNAFRGNEDPEEYAKNNPNLIAAYGVTEKAFENFRAVAGVRKAAGDVGEYVEKVRKGKNTPQPELESTPAEGGSVSHDIKRTGGIL